MTNAEFYAMKDTNFTDLAIGDRFMIVGGEIFTKCSDDCAKNWRNHHDTDSYRFSAYSKTKKLAPIK